MLVLDPARPPVWRTPDDLQFGPDDSVRLHHPAPWQERMITELSRGLPDVAVEPVALALGASAHDARALIALLGPVLITPGTRLAASVAVEADSPALAPAAAQVTAGLRAHGAAITSDSRSADAVLIVAAHVVDPRHAARLLREDIRHLPLVLHGDTVTVGPMVVPGATACLTCLEAARRDADPAWPAVATQLLHAPPPPAPGGLIIEAGLVAARMVGEVSDAPVTRSLTLSARSHRRSWRTHRPHAACGCRSLAESVTAAVPASDPRRATTTATASALPA